jgi:hypothetical protein
MITTDTGVLALSAPLDAQQPQPIARVSRKAFDVPIILFLTADCAGQDQGKPPYLHR